MACWNARWTAALTSAGLEFRDSLMLRSLCSSILIIIDLNDHFMASSAAITLLRLQKAQGNVHWREPRTASYVQFELPLGTHYEISAAQRHGQYRGDSGCGRLFRSEHSARSGAA